MASWEMILEFQISFENIGTNPLTLPLISIKKMTSYCFKEDFLFGQVLENESYS